MAFVAMKEQNQEVHDSESNHIDNHSSNTEKHIATTTPPTNKGSPAEKKEDHNNAQTSHRKIDKLVAESKLKETAVDSDVDGHNTSPSGAILSLTMGLCLTAFMVVLVGCRMKMVRRRMRRGGKSSYAHDADFLVNGMYL